MSNIRQHALAWLRKELNNPKYIQLKLGWYNCKDNVATSKYYVAEKAFPRIPVWWLQVPIAKIQEMEPCGSFLLVCQKHVGNISEFHLLVVPKSYLLKHYQNGNLAILGKSISLELSVEKCRYNGYDINVFDDVCSTRRLRRNPILFGQFQVNDC
jgi:hypothetical protein